MSEQNPPGDEPTQAYSVYNDDATRLERPIQPYGDQNPEAPSPYSQDQYGGAHSLPASGPGIVAPLVTVALLSILVGIGIGYLLFHDSNKTSNTKNATTTTTSVPALVSSSTTGFTTTSTTQPSTTSTTHRLSTTTTSHSTTTSEPKTSTSESTTSSLLKLTTTTSKDTTSSTT